MKLFCTFTSSLLLIAAPSAVSPAFAQATPPTGEAAPMLEIEAPKAIVLPEMLQHFQKAEPKNPASLRSIRSQENPVKLFRAGDEFLSIEKRDELFVNRDGEQVTRTTLVTCSFLLRSLEEPDLICGQRPKDFQLIEQTENSARLRIIPPKR